MRFEVITGEDADRAQKAGAQLEVWTEIAGWIETTWPIDEWSKGRIYRIKPKPPVKRRVPLPDLRVLAGAMLVYPNTEGYIGINAIHPNFRSLYVKNELELDAHFLADQRFHYDRGAGPVPCWTEEEE